MFLETGGSNSLEKGWEKRRFVRGKLIIGSEVKYKLEQQRKGGSKQLPISDSAPVALLWIKYGNKIKKFITFL